MKLWPDGSTLLFEFAETQSNSKTSHKLQDKLKNVQNNEKKHGPVLLLLFFFVGIIKNNVKTWNNPIIIKLSCNMTIKAENVTGKYSSSIKF